VTRVRAARLLILALASSLFAAEHPGAWLLTMLGLTAFAAVATGPTVQRVLFRLPHWVFRALRIPQREHPTVPTLARAWWLPFEG
jgi:hypothetical protein